MLAGFEKMRSFLWGFFAFLVYFGIMCWSLFWVLKLKFVGLGWGGFRVVSVGVG